MKTKKIGRRTVISFIYTEWVKAGKILPPLPEGLVIDGVTEYVITEVPEDKKDYFLSLGWMVRLSVNKGKGMRKL